MSPLTLLMRLSLLDSRHYASASHIGLTGSRRHREPGPHCCGLSVAGEALTGHIAAPEGGKIAGFARSSRTATVHKERGSGMCEDYAGISRRTFMHGGAVVGAAAAIGLPQDLPLRLPLRSPARAVTASGAKAYSMAMHIHSSFSEQNGSMYGHLFQAAKNAVDVLWWTDHDHRMDAAGYRNVTHFTSFSEKGAPGQGGAWSWTLAKSGPNTTASTGAIVSTPCSPHDPVKGGALQLVAKSSNTSPARYGYFADCR